MAYDKNVFQNHRKDNSTLPVHKLQQNLHNVLFSYHNSMNNMRNSLNRNIENDTDKNFDRNIDRNVDRNFENRRSRNLNLLNEEDKQDIINGLYNQYFA